MKMQQVSEHVWSVKGRMLILPVHVWLVRDSEGVTLVDAGISSMSDGILQFIESLDIGPLRRVVLTHGHSDHVGSVTKILSKASVPVYAHRIEIPYIEGKLPYPRRKKPERIIATGVVQALPETPDNQLDPIAGLKPYLAPGHSPGHVVYYHEQDEVLLAGDLFTSKNGQLRRPMPMFTADMREALASGAIVTRLRPTRLEVCHGDAVLAPATKWEAYAKKYAITGGR